MISEIQKTRLGSSISYYDNTLYKADQGRKRISFDSYFGRRVHRGWDDALAGVRGD